MKRKYMLCIIASMFLVLPLSHTGSFAYDINDKFSIGGIMAGVGQYQWVDGDENKGRNCNYFAGQVAYKLNTSLGEGNYRLIVDTTSEDFKDEDGRDDESRLAAFLSFDQQLGDIFGAFIRLGWQDDDPDITCNALYSGGLNITGKWYGREQDNFGIGYAYLNGENDFDYSQVAEIYWRVVFNDYFATTADFQYMKDKFDSSEDDIEGVIGGIRLTAEL